MFQKMSLKNFINYGNKEFVLQWHLTNKCDMRCLHCYVPHVDKSVYVHDVSISRDFSPFGVKFDFKNSNLNEKRTILFLGKLNKSKGVDYLLDAFIQNGRPKNLLFIGCGKNKQAYIERIKNKNLQNIYFIDSQPPWIVPEIMRAADAVVVPECDFGVKTHTSRIPLEAMCCGTPVLLSCDVARKYGEGFENCYLEVNPRDKKNFAKSLDGIIYDAGLRNKLVRNSSRIREQNDFTAYLNRMEEIFQRIIS